MVIPTHWEIRASSPHQIQWWAFEAPTPEAAELLARNEPSLRGFRVRTTGIGLRSPRGHRFIRQARVER